MLHHAGVTVFGEGGGGGGGGGGTVANTSMRPDNVQEVLLVGGWNCSLFFHVTMREPLM